MSIEELKMVLELAEHMSNGAAQLVVFYVLVGFAETAVTCITMFYICKGLGGAIVKAFQKMSEY
jgi:hypothetical protein